MFEHFTFAAAHAQPFERDDISPTDTTYSSPVSHISYKDYPFPNPSQSEINDIVYRLGQQTLVPGDKDHRIPYWQHSLPTPPLEDSDHDAEMSYQSDTISARLAERQSVPSTPRHNSVSCRRLQRQLNVQLQTCNSHVRDIDALVSDMISTSSQCRLRRIASRQALDTNFSSRSQAPFSAVEVSDSYLNTPSYKPLSMDQTLSGIDEGYDDGEAVGQEGSHEEEENNVRRLDAEFSLRRSSAPSGIRKTPGLKFKKSLDFVPARLKVARLPRMRKRVSERKLHDGKTRR